MPLSHSLKHLSYLTNDRLSVAVLSFINSEKFFIYAILISMAKSFDLLILTFILVTVCLHQSSAQTLPVDDTLEVMVGEDANITCRMDMPSVRRRNSSSLYFRTEDEQIVPKSNIAIINETTIVYMLRNASMQDSYYKCYSGRDGVGMTRVRVGTKPASVENFRCRSFNFLYMNCSFDIPHNVVPSNYFLQYQTQSPNYIQKYDKFDVVDSKAVFNLTLENGSYKRDYEFYNFTLVSENVFGTRIQPFWVNHTASVQPAISQFSVESVTVNSCTLTWEMETYAFYRQRWLQFEVRVHAPHYESLRKFDSKKRGYRSSFTVKNLPYAYYNYNISLRLAMKGDDPIWSEPYVRVFRTLPSPAETPPRTDTGSFHIKSTHIRLFWQPHPVYHENGSDFRYIVKKVQENGKRFKLEQDPIESDRNSALFQWQGEHSYEFSIRSQNANGMSAQSSRIFVPAMPKNNNERSPRWIRNVYHSSNRSHTLSWTAPIDKQDLTNYTVFWCHSRSVVSDECNDVIGFAHLGRDELQFNMAAPESQHPMVLAVSANYEGYYTGMHMSMCPVDVDSDVEKVTPEIVTIEANSIKLDWNLERVCASLVEDYVLTYCRVAHKLSHACIEHANTTKIEKSESRYVLTGLKPFSSYKIVMHMSSSLKAGPDSDLWVTTLQAAPSPPHNLTFKNITSKSVSISWMPPAQTNGHVKYYTIVQNTERHTLSCSDIAGSICSIGNNTDADVQSEITFTLENLSSFTNYTVYVIAHTVADSAPSNLIAFQTLIGVPDSPQKVSTKNMVDNVTLFWEPPLMPSGRVEFYEVIVTLFFNGQKQTQHVSRIIGSTSCSMRNPSCINNNYKYTIEVRAVNAARHDEVDPSITHDTSSYMEPYQDSDELRCIISASSVNWARNEELLTKYSSADDYVLYRSAEGVGNPLQYLCGTPKKLSKSILMPYLGLIVAVMLAIIATAFLYKKCKRMASIECKIPSGLATISSSGGGMGGVINGIIDRDELDAERCKEVLYNNEHRRLLCNEPGYLGDFVRSWSMDKSSGYAGSDRSNDYSPDDFAETHCKQMPLVPAADAFYTVMMSPQQSTEHASGYVAAEQMHPDSGYVRPSTMLTGTNAILAKSAPPNWHMIQSENGYVKPNKSQMLNWQPDTSGTEAYDNSLPKGAVPVSGVGYTTMKSLDKSAMNPLSKPNFTTSPGYICMKESTNTAACG